MTVKQVPRRKESYDSLAHIARHDENIIVSHIPRLDKDETDSHLSIANVTTFELMSKSFKPAVFRTRILSVIINI